MTLQIKSLEQYNEVYRESVENPEKFWAEQAETFQWQQKWDKVLSWDFKKPEVKWFEGGKMNITENCLDRHLADRGNQTAILWEPNDPNQKTVKYSYQELYEQVCRFGNALRAKGIKKGDRVCFYMPMVAELAIGVLACARIGAVHSVVFAGFSATALADRIKDATCKMVICSDYNARGTKNIPVKQVVDEAILQGCTSVETVIVHKNTGGKVNWEPARDVWWSDAVYRRQKHCKPAAMNSEDMLFILYTSGSTGKPKGVVHTCGGYMVYTCFSFKNVFQYEKGDVYWCTADIGWITGHSYIVYGPLLAGATTMMFEGVPTYPDAGRFWQICEKHKVNQFYTAPTAIRALMAKGDEFVEGYDLSDLKVIGSVGEPINEEAWNWYNEKGIMITPLPGITDTKPCYASYPMPGIQPILVDSQGELVEGNDVEGLLCVKFPWPSMIRTTYGDHERCRQVYFSSFDNLYFTGDGCRRDSEGRLRIIGRVDDVINVSGHRMGTAEVENAINEHAAVLESAVVGYPHDIKGQGIFAYIIAQEGTVEMLVVPGLPKTRSGKIMRRILRKIASGDASNLGDISTLLNPDVVAVIREAAGV